MKVGIVGSGVMGMGIAQVAADHGHEVAVYDAYADAVHVGITKLADTLQRLVYKDKWTEERKSAVLDRIKAAEALSELADTGLVIEAVTENLKVKQQVFSDLNRVCQRDAILASNTSSLSITALASACENPERVVGMHFFNPVPLMKLVEVVEGRLTSPETTKAIRDLAKSWGKTAVVCQDTPGFIVNRVARPFYLEALRCLQEGVTDVETIDKLMESVGFRMGPFTLVDLIGIDVNFSVTKAVYESTYGESRYRPSPIQEQMVAAKLLGRKTGRGFYSYEE